MVGAKTVGTIFRWVKDARTANVSRRSVVTSFCPGGGVQFTTGILLSVYRDRLLTLPEEVLRREGLSRLLSWRYTSDGDNTAGSGTTALTWNLN
jgi:hypothetical protein